MTSTSARTVLPLEIEAPVRPLVAVAPARLAPGRIVSWSDGGEAAGVAYLSGLRRGGCLPAVVGGPLDAAPADILAPFSGLVLLGGADLDPHLYGQEPHPATYDVDPDRDAFEIGLARHALERGLALLAICRGLQILNVAAGGSLHQHVPDLPGAGAHGVPIGGGEPSLHPVVVEPTSRLAAVQAVGGRLDRCVSIHHQSADRIGDGLLVTARSPDGIVEALETPMAAPGWCLAVQWHPERSAGTDPAQQAVFDAFVAAAADRR